MTAVAAGKYQDLHGIHPAFAAVNVYLTGTTTAATLYTDASSGVAASNPVTSDANGDLVFFAIDGTYDLVWTDGTVTNKVTITIRSGGTGAMTWTPGIPACAGNIGDLAVNQAGAAGTKTNLYFCTVAGAAGSATWVGIA